MINTLTKLKFKAICKLNFVQKKEYVHQKRQEKLKRQIQTHKQEMEQQYGFVPISGAKNYSSYWDN